MPEFLAGSSVREAVFHADRFDEIARLAAKGTGDLAVRGAPGVLGAGFYTTQKRPSRMYGPATAAVAINAKRPLVTPSFAAFDARFGSVISRPMADVREAVRVAGYDSVVLQRRFESDWVVAVDSPNQVRTIVADVAPDRAADFVGALRRGIAGKLSDIVPSWT